MRRAAMAYGLAFLVSACGDPLAGLPRISDVELSGADPAAQALPTEDEIAREGFFGTSATEQAEVAPVMPADAPAEEDPAALTGAQVAAAAPVAAEKPRGLLGLLRRVVPQPAPQVALTEATPEALETTDLPTVAEAPQDATTTTPVGDAAIELAALTPEPEEPPAATVPKRRGLLGRLMQPAAPAEKPHEGVDKLDVEYGTLLPYGVVARSCASKRQPLGRKIETATATRYKLYDSNPRANGPRTFYITGFDDGCPRQLTAAHVLFGAPSMYELLHYGPAGQHLKLAETDKAYEQVKSRVCGVRRGKPCGARMERLENDTFFVNAYERVDDNRRWSELLVHDSVVVAQAMK